MKLKLPSVNTVDKEGKKFSEFEGGVSLATYKRGGWISNLQGALCNTAAIQAVFWIETRWCKGVNCPWWFLVSLLYGLGQVLINLVIL